VDFAERAFAGEKDKFAAFFQGDIGGAGNERIAESHANGGERFHATGRDDHAVRFERAAGNWRRLVVVMIDGGGQRFDLREREGGFVSNGGAGPLTDDEMCLYTEFTQRFQRADAEDGPGRAGDAHDKSHLG